MSRKYYISLLVYSIVKSSTVAAWLMMLNEGIIDFPLSLQDFITPVYALLAILLLILLPKVPADSKRTKIAMITLVVGLLMLNLYRTISSFFPFYLNDYKIGGAILSAVGSVIFCTAILTLIYETIKFGRPTIQRLKS